MVKVYFKYNNGSYADLVAIFDDEETYGKCYPALKKYATSMNFDTITESVNDDDIRELE